MGKLGSLETAMRMRDIISAQSTSTATNVMPTVLVGRFTEVDFDNMKGRVWFPGDDEPTEVNLLPNAMPANWDSEGTSTEGYGSVAYVQSIGGKFYATNIISGGSYAVDFSAAGFGIRAESPGSRGYGTNPISDTYEFFANIDLPDTGTQFLEGEALVFGPFVTRNFMTGVTNTDFGGWLRIAVSHRDQTTKLYETVISANDLSETGGWARISPSHEVCYDGSDNIRFELDVRRITTTDVVDSNGVAVPAFYFRIVKGIGNYTDMPFKVAINAGGLFNYARTAGLRNQLTVTHDQYPEDIQGYLGFHSSGSIYSDVIGTRDSFRKPPRAVGEGWGPMTGNPSVSWVHNQSLTKYWANGRQGAITCDVGGNDYQSRIPISLKDREMEVEFDLTSDNNTANGAEFNVRFFVRWDTTVNTAYIFYATFKTDGFIDMTIRKVVTGTLTTLATSTPFSGSSDYNMNNPPHNRFKAKVSCVSNRLKFNIWKVDQIDEDRWVLEITDSSITTAGIAGFGVQRPLGNNNNSLKAYFRDFKESDLSSLSSNGATWNTGPYRSARLRAANDIQKVLNTGGSIKFDGNSIKWTDPIEFEGTGIHPDILSEGRAYLTCPDTNTAVSTIPILPEGFDGNPSTAVTIDGIQIEPGQSLWCAIPPGFPNFDLMKYLFIVDSRRQLLDPDISGPTSMMLPEWAVMIAGRSLNGMVMKTGIGVQCEYTSPASMEYMPPGAIAIVREGTGVAYSTTTMTAMTSLRMVLKPNARYEYELWVPYSVSATTVRAKVDWTVTGTTPTDWDRFVTAPGYDNVATQRQVTSMFVAKIPGTQLATVGSFSLADAATIGSGQSIYHDRGYIRTGSAKVEIGARFAPDTAGTLTILMGAQLRVTRLG